MSWVIFLAVVGVAVYFAWKTTQPSPLLKVDNQPSTPVPTEPKRDCASYGFDACLNGMCSDPATSCLEVELGLFCCVPTPTLTPEPTPEPTSNNTVKKEATRANRKYGGKVKKKVKQV
jgi:hypothetical protein